MSVPPGKWRYPLTNPEGFFFDKAVSAWRAPFCARPAAAELLKVVAPGDHVVFYSVDRGFRSTRAFTNQVEDWLAHDITPHFVQENINFGTAIGRLMGNVMASVAQYYSDVISERTREALRIKRLRAEPDAPKRERYRWMDSDVRMPNQKLFAQPKHLVIPGRIFLYARCSHYDSMLSGLGMEQQIGGIQAHAQRLASDRPWLTIHPEVFRDDSVSAFSREFHQRPSGKRLLDMLQPGDQVIVYRLDRAWRLPHDAAKMAKDLGTKNIGIHIVDAGIDTLSEFGEMWVTLLSVFAYLESKIKSNRNLEVAAMCRESGRPYSPTPRHLKVVKHKNARKLAYDFGEIKRFAVCWLCRHALDISERDTCEIIHAIDCQLTKREPVWFSMRQQRWGERRRMQNSIQRFVELLEILPQSAMDDAIGEAIQLLETPIDPRYARFCTYPLPLTDVRARMEARLHALESDRSVAAGT